MPYHVISCHHALWRTMLMDAETLYIFYVYICVLCIYKDCMCIRLYLYIKSNHLYYIIILYRWPRSRLLPKHRCQTRCSADSWIDCSKWNQNSRAKILEPKSKKEQMIKGTIADIYRFMNLMNKSFSTDLEPLLNYLARGIQDCYTFWPEQLPLWKLRKRSFRLVDHSGLAIFIWDWHL